MARRASRLALFALLWVGVGAPAPAEIADTLHNLSASGPAGGTYKAAGVTEICVFCHTPHNASPQRALWNRELSGETYTLYDSSTLHAVLDQPTGSSRLCLSCHDGTLALGTMREPSSTGVAGLGALTGDANLGTDLSDDHPISFEYDAGLAFTHGELAQPGTLPASEVPLEAGGRLECTTCHDPHADPYRKFLRLDDRGGALCTACHEPQEWASSAHATSTATWSGSGTNPWPGSPFTNVADNACRSCHRSHAAQHPDRLLTQGEEPAVCLVCHDGSVAELNLDLVFTGSFSSHPIDAAEWVHEPDEDPGTMTRHVTCADCHNPHQAVSDSVASSAPDIPGPLKGVQGVSLSGTPTPGPAEFEYQVCLKCHGLRGQTGLDAVVRVDDTRNVAAEIDPGNPSYHPVVEAGANPTVGGFEPGYSASSVIYCTDCHNNDEWTSGGNRPRGPHGSQYAPILEREYQVDLPTPESIQSYALCYKCHNRGALMNDAVQEFPHRLHVEENDTPCAACHDAHGSREYPALINFMRFDRVGNTVTTDSANGRLEFVDLGTGRGECSLSCHGKDHDALAYP